MSVVHEIGMCMACLTSVHLLKRDYIKTDCCSKVVCVNCYETVKICSLCKITLKAQSLPEEDTTEPTTLLQPAYAELSDDGKNVIHYVTKSDTLVGVSLRYGISVPELRRVNSLFSNDIFCKKKLLIPIAYLPDNVVAPSNEWKKEQKRKQALVKFRREMQVSLEETIFYVDQAEGDFDNAKVAFLADVEWSKIQATKTTEKSHQIVNVVIPNGVVENSSINSPHATPQHQPGHNHIEMTELAVR
eukprot:Lithocolla_globosa_v1_NODE_6067_length_1142_cov_6.632015.p1 type:complete len:245 gc:universal NODE_6067_length_1142_cov_6.632015:977-243(-)